MKNLEIFLLYETLTELSNDATIKLPVKIGYICLRNKNLLEPYYNAIDEFRTNVIQEYGYLTENGSYDFEPEKLKIANDKLNELLEVEEDIELQKINIDNMNLDLSMETINGLMPMLENGEEGEEKIDD